MDILYKKEAIKKLKKLGIAEKQKVKKKIEIILTNPLTGKNLKGEFEGLRSLKAWPVRIIFSFDPNKQRIIIVTVDYRGSVYK